MLNRIKNFFPAVVAILVAFPVLASAQTIFTILDKVRLIMGYAVPLIMTLALIYFFLGLAKYISGAGDEEKQKEARGMMIWGVIILFVMAAVWGLVGVVGRSFGIQTGGQAPRVDIPTVPTN